MITPAAQCHNNIKAWFRYQGLREPYIVEAKEDRCYFAYANWFAEWVFNEAASSGGKFLSFFSGYREQVPKTSMEIQFRSDRIIEIDFDYYNPDYGLFYMALHGVECLRNKIGMHKTDPFKIAKGLEKRGIIFY